MEDTVLYRIISFLSNHFELLICINGAILVAFLLALIAVKLREIKLWKILRLFLKEIFYYGIVASQVILFFLFAYLYWQNYQRPAPELNLERDILASTNWVKNDTRIFFIDGNKLRSVGVNDRGSREVFVGKDAIKEYHFSPDGGYLLILTQKELFLLDRKNGGTQLIDTLEIPEIQPPQAQEVALKGSISGIQWAPDSRKFVYQIARWSRFSAQESAFLYDVKANRKKMIQSPARAVSSLYWDRLSENLYYFYHEAQDTSAGASPFEIKVFRVPIATLTPELIARIPFEKASVPVENLVLRDIDLFLEGGRFSFGRPDQKNDLVSEKGTSLGIDENDYLYYVNFKWFRKRLFKIPRDPKLTDLSRYQYRGGDLILDDIRWIPGGRYVIMEHKYWGILILEPSTGRIGLLIRANGHAFGWYQDKSARK